MSRVVAKDFTFSNGIFLPAGSYIAVPLYAMQHDDAIHSNANEFDPYRFFRKQEQGGEDAKLQMVTPSADYLPFGYGKHAWCVLEMC
jgi:cytochrome P450